MYADDTNIFFSAQTVTQLNTAINGYLIKLEEWLHKNRLTLNIKKTKYIIFKPYNKPCDSELVLNFQGTALQLMTSEKFLGIWFEEAMSWNTHVSKLAIDLSKTVSCL